MSEEISQSLGVFILGVLAGWVVEWIFVRLFVPNPGKNAEAALQTIRKEVEGLQQKNHELQEALAAAQSDAAKAMGAALKIPEPEPALIDVHPISPEAKSVPAVEEAFEAEPSAKIEADANPVPAMATTEMKSEATPAAVPIVTDAGNDDSKDDFTKLAGIGPKLAEAMYVAGIGRYAQLAELTVDELSERLAPSGIRYSKATAESWASQAKWAAAEDWDGLKKFQASLKG
ncbi:helix-hairpin-helix domain-containing protein [Candidatus Thiothrix sp. Deng01]|uniref:Helix-hairpin-helix domain-containing protein n=1 Tax=Candidatus Thiothrix phosphatis TaxID=3112415 RepID=A0ABU6CSH3_9GAMM|nr:helix-hairpin-helix domain-containing protein [Candidatus Thiothrix sp. Deng01]MEB4589795.1 helix-hairpin-helix domain-containing protein [Candidatus Thiothrix sp. Deng01]